MCGKIQIQERVMLDKVVKCVRSMSPSQQEPEGAVEEAMAGRVAKLWTPMLPWGTVTQIKVM